MKFTSYRNWVNEIDANLHRADMPKTEHDAWEDLASEGITVLYPGGFKPTSGGHLDLIRRYAENELVKEVRVLIGPSVRDGIDQTKATKIAERLTKDMPKVVVEPVKWPSPVLTAYKIIGEAEPGYYTLAASSKGEDFKRVEDFVRKHRTGEKFSRDHEGVHVIQMPMDVEPLIFRGRNDEHEGEPVSASVLRNDIVNDDFDNFVAGYPHSDPEDIQYVWEELAETVMNESQYTSGTSTTPGMGTAQSTAGNYDRAQSGYAYKSLFPILEDEDDVEDISEGGGAGHLMSPWEATDMTFGEIEKLIESALSGQLEQVTEKLDGQNLMITVRGGDTYLARTQKQMKNLGELAIKWDDVHQSMGERTPDFIKKAFQEAANDLQTIFENSKLSLDKVFKNGSRWLNIELLNPETENIVPYGEFQLRIHNMREVDMNGKEVGVTWEGGDLDKILQEIERVQATGDIDKIHLIGKTNKVDFKKIKESSKILETILKKLQSLMNRNHLDADNTIGDYLAQELRAWTSKNIKDPELIEDLVNRWAYGIKSKNISQILKGADKVSTDWARKSDSKIDDRIGELLDPIIEIFSRVGIAVLQNLSGIAASNTAAVSEGIRKKSEDAINRIQRYIQKTDVEDQEDFQKKINYLETQLRRIEQAGGLEGIAPVEGIVFEYNGRLFKLTGIYLPILKMINFFQFGKDQ
jgi:hypothetical protein